MCWICKYLYSWYLVQVLALCIDCMCMTDIGSARTFRLFTHVAHTRLACTRLTCTHIDRTNIARVACTRTVRTHIVSLLEHKWYHCIPHIAHICIYRCWHHVVFGNTCRTFVFTDVYSALLFTDTSITFHMLAHMSSTGCLYW